MTIFEERLITITGFTIGVKIWGPQDGRPVLAFHGMLDNAASYDLLAPLLPQMRLIAVDSPGTGRSSHYPDGVLPHWMNDSFLMMHLADALELEHFDLIGHSLGSIFAVVLAIVMPERIGKVVLLDCFGPLSTFQEKSKQYLKQAAHTFLQHNDTSHALFPSLEAAITERMQHGGVSFQAAKALAERGTHNVEGGVAWNFDRRLRCGGVTFPFDDRVRALFGMIEKPVCVIRADNGLRYPEEILRPRMAAFSNLTTRHVKGGHHVHMDDPTPVAAHIREFLTDM